MTLLILIVINALLIYLTYLLNKELREIFKYKIGQVDELYKIMNLQEQEIKQLFKLTDKKIHDEKYKQVISE